MNKQSRTTIRVPSRRKKSVLQMSGATLTVGTRILTSLGEKLVEDLRPGDLVISKDHGAQAVRYTAFQDVTTSGQENLSPISLLYPGVGHVYFAPSQKIVLRHPMFDMLFGNPEVLVKCEDLIDMPNVTSMSGLTSITYVALGFAHRHLITCNGVLADVGPFDKAASRICVGAEEARLAWRLMSPTENLPKRHGFPLH